MASHSHQLIARSLAKTQYYDQLAEEFSQWTHFSAEECRALLNTYDQLTLVGKLDKVRFREFLHCCFELTDDLMLDLTFYAFDTAGDGHISCHEFVTGLSKMIRGDLKELSEFCYSIYDINKDKSIAREELSQCLKGCLTSGYGLDPDELEDAERDLVNMAIKKLDKNCDWLRLYN